MTKTAGNSLAKKGASVPVEKKPKTIYDVIKAGEKQFAAALPKHVNSDRFVRIAITQIRNNPELAKCSQESLLGSLMLSAQLGLEPGVLNQCYLIPYKNKKLGTVEAQFQISYKGMIELLRRSGQLSDIYAYSVYENDEFTIEYGLSRDLIHKPNFKDRGEITGYYAVAKLKDGTIAFEFMTKKEIEDHAKKFSVAFKNGFNSPWKTDFEAMAHKTVVKKLLKWLPVSVEFIENLRKDETVNVVKDAEQFDTAENVELEMKEDNIIEIVDDLDINAPITNAQSKELVEKAEFLGAPLTKEIENRYKVKLIGQITQGQYLEMKEWLDDGAPTE